jgi:hypothetical protein
LVIYRCFEAKLFSRDAEPFSPHAPRGLAMDLFEKKQFLIPIELVIVLAINLVVAVLCYYATMMWGLFS